MCSVLLLGALTVGAASPVVSESNATAAAETTESSPAQILTPHDGRAAAGPRYKPSSRSPEALDIFSDAYGASADAPLALRIGDVAPDFTLQRAGGGVVNLRAARADGPVAIIFYRGHW